MLRVFHDQRFCSQLLIRAKNNRLLVKSNMLVRLSAGSHHSSLLADRNERISHFSKDSKIASYLSFKISSMVANRFKTSPSLY